MLKDMVSEAVVDGSEIKIKLYNNPTTKWEKKHNKDMERLIHTFGLLTEDKPDDISFCECTDKNERYTTILFSVQCLEFINNTIKQIKGE